MNRLVNNIATFLWMVLALLWGTSPALAASQQPSQGLKLANAAEHENMQLIGTNDLQHRSTYQPTLHKYPNGRYILFTGHHALANQGEGNLPGGQPLPSFNPLTGLNEPNGTSLVDVTDPKNPVLLAHIPAGVNASVKPPAQPLTNGGAQMVRVCDGATLPVHNDKVYMLRSYQNSAHEIWDVTNPSVPLPVRTVAGGNPVLGADTGKPGALAGTHKSWWECDTGVAYVVGRRGNDTGKGWAGGNHIFIMYLGDPEHPAASDFLRDWALDGQQPGGVTPPHFTSTPSIHGPISTGPSAAHTLAGNSANPIAGTGATLDRVYFAYGTGSNGVMQIVDRTKLLPAPWGTGVRCGSPTDTTGGPQSCASPPTSYTTAELGRLIMNPDNGAHTSFPIGTITVPDFVTDTGNDNGFTTRDVVVITSEATAHFVPRSAT